MPRSNSVLLSRASLLLPLVFFAAPAWCTPPVLYSASVYESPVRGDPDDLLLLAGSGLAAGDTVVYRSIVNTTSLPAPPSPLPTFSNAVKGIADLVSVADAPYSLTVHLPRLMTAGQSYALWVLDAAGEWSNPVLINDARPLWITPDSAYQTASLANLPRVLKVIGRNLQPGPGTSTVTQVLLTGITTGTTYTLTANNTGNDPNTTAALERYVAAVNLPSALVADRYTVQVSRDGTSWVPLSGDGTAQWPPQVFIVNPDPVAPTSATTFPVGNPQVSDPILGESCQAVQANGDDATGCIILAIRAAQAARGGTVTFGPGKWLLSNAGTWNGQGYSNRIGYAAGYCPGDAQTCGVSYDGVIVPVGVNLQGAGASGPGATIIERSTAWPAINAVFVLQGNNTVSGFDFTDDNKYLTDYANGTSVGSELQLGVDWWDAFTWSTSDPLTVSNVTITNNVFDKPNIAINSAGLPVDHLYITDNTFGGAFNTAIGAGDDENTARNLSPATATPFYTYTPYNWSDSVVAYNTFYPSSYQDTSTGNGSIATQINTGLRADFSNNLADGTSTAYFYSPTDPKGWRAAFFWSTGGGQEMTLVSNNTIYCSGDKYGDGEAIAYDGTGELGGMPAAEPVISSAPWTDTNQIAGTSVTVQGSVVTQLPTSNGVVDISANPTAYYGVGFWLQVSQGMGQGEWRKVESVSLGSNAAGPTVTLNVTPAFDVPPDASSMVILEHAYWQNVTVNNLVNQSTPLCTDLNAKGGGGSMTWYASAGDSVMEGNQQYGTSGILVHHTYNPIQPGGGTVTPAVPVSQSHNEVRNNLLSGMYDPTTLAGTAGGIQLAYSATSYYCNNTTCPAPTPTGTGFGLSVAGNTIVAADARDADGSVHEPIGAIGLNSNYGETGPNDALGVTMWPLGDTNLVFHNSLQNISTSVTGSGGLPLVGIGVDVAYGATANPAITWRSILYDNSCSTVDTFTQDFGLGTVRYCPNATSASSCECSGLASLDVGVAATGSSGPVAAGSSVPYTVTVTNHDSSNTASDVTLFLEPSAGVQVTGTSFTSSQGTCDSSVNVCLLGSLPAGQSATVSVSAALPTSGAWPVTFSVAHHEPDSVPSNNSVTVTESVQ